MKRLSYALGLIFALAVVTLVTTPPARRVAAEDAPQPDRETAGVLRDDPTPNPFFVAPPPGVLDGRPRRADALPISVVYNPTFNAANPPANAGDLCAPVHPSDPNPMSPTMTLQPWPAAARTAMDTAALIWSTLLNGTQPVVVNACWYATLDPPTSPPSPPSTLGQARPTSPFYIIDGVRYPVALANQLSNVDWNEGRPEIKASFSGNFYWYFGVDGLIPPDPVVPGDPTTRRSDFLSVALHELGHGLGFLGSAQIDDGLDPKECDGKKGHGCIQVPPRTYDRFAYFGPTPISSFTDLSVLGTALTVSNWFFNGPSANAANGNAPARLYAPSTWEPGSSYSHLDEVTFDKTPSALMTPALGRLEVVHHPGPVALGMMADMGWTVNDRSFVYVDGGFVGQETGAKLQPYNTVREGVSAVARGGTVWITSGTYAEEMTISRPMWLKTTGGTVTIGK